MTCTHVCTHEILKSDGKINAVLSNIKILFKHKLLDLANNQPVFRKDNKDIKKVQIICYTMMHMSQLVTGSCVPAR